MRPVILEEGVSPALFVACFTQLTKESVPNGDDVAPLYSRTKVPEIGNDKTVARVRDLGASNPACQY